MHSLRCGELLTTQATTSMRRPVHRGNDSFTTSLSSDWVQGSSSTSARKENSRKNNKQKSRLRSVELRRRASKFVTELLAVKDPESTDSSTKQQRKKSLGSRTSSSAASFDELDPEQHIFKSADDELQALTIQELMEPVKEDLAEMTANLKNVIGRKNPLLIAAADQIFGAGGKRLRPVLVLLVARATAALMKLPDINAKHRRIAEITEMLHTASLVHDDVLDECDERRGSTTINCLYGTRVAVLAGDFLFAQSSWGLAQLENLEVIKLISQVIADFADGEISQATALFNTDITFEDYNIKSHQKTGSLIAASCKSAAVFSDVPLDVKDDMYAYGKHLGLAFQIVDDILDFTQTREQLGKPPGQDLATGNLTAPTLFALQADDRLKALIDTRFKDPKDLELALQIVNEKGIKESMKMARREADKARAALSKLPDSASKQSLDSMIEYVLMRIN
jgi:all-trans-nonaprenyl-diphosphate synthase